MLIPYAYSCEVEGKMFITKNPKVRDDWVANGLTVTSMYTLPQINGAVRAVFSTPRELLPA